MQQNMKSILYALLAASVVFLIGCSSHLSKSPLTPNSYMVARENTQSSLLYKAAKPNLNLHPDESGVFPLADGLDSFVARLALVAAAEYSVDLQYYLYHADEVGFILTQALITAADRGVRVRMLVDDMATKGKDNVLLLLNQHPNIQLRLYNPFLHRSFRALDFLSDFGRVNRRMHNKSITADNAASIVGGRNIGSEYFDGNKATNFGDFDLLSIGPVVSEVSQQFDSYWNGALAIPVEHLIKKPLSAKQDAKLRQDHLKRVRQIGDSEYVKRLDKADIIATLRGLEAPWFWGPAKALFDDTNKTLDKLSDQSELLASSLASLLDDANNSITLVSPYFVPGEAGTNMLLSHVARGVDVRVITNSLAATDVVAVHSGYSRYRKALLKGGLEIYEVKARPNAKPGTWKGSNGASLHAKTFVIDDRQVFVGSFNIDPRSIALNTELGLLVDSHNLALLIDRGITEELSAKTYRLSLEADSIRWHDDEIDTVGSVEPDASIFRRIGAKVMTWLPIEKLL